MSLRSARSSLVPTGSLLIRHVVNLSQHTCTCREWQVSGKPCPHALAVITTIRNPKWEEFLHPYFSVYNFRIAYGGVIRPFPDKSQWPQVELGFRVLPPLVKRQVGRQKKNRIPEFLENKGNKPRTKGMWQVTCKTCFEKGHRSSSPKCPMNGTKKRKSRAKAKVGRPLNSVGESSSRATKKKKTAAEEGNTSPGPVTRSQMQKEMEGAAEITAGYNSPGPMTTRSTECKLSFHTPEVRRTQAQDLLLEASYTRLGAVQVRHATRLA